MKITRLEIRNCLGIKELKLQTGKINVISGGNEVGKTSVLETIEKALYNTERRAEFIRKGETEGTLYVELDGLSVERKVRAGGKASVKVSQDGTTVRKPETFLKSLVGEHSFAFNPVDFMQRNDKEQTSILLSLIPITLTEDNLQEWFNEVPPVNLNQHGIEVLNELAERYYYDKRTSANAEVREAEHEIDSLFNQLPDNYNGDHWRDVKTMDFWAKLNSATKINITRQKAQEVLDAEAEKKEAIENSYQLELSRAEEKKTVKIQMIKDKAEARKGSLREGIQEIEEEIQRLQAQIQTMNKELDMVDEQLAEQVKEIQKDTEKAEEAKKLRDIDTETLERNLQAAREYLEKYPEALDTDKIEAEAENAEKMKGYVPLWDNYLKLKDDLKDKKFRASRLDQNVKHARQLPAQLLQKVKMPVEGLGIDEKTMQITIDGLPIRNLSTSRQIRLALDIARATAGPLKLVCIDRFESLSKENQGLMLEEMGKDDYQYFVTTVTEGPLTIEEYQGGEAVGS